MKSIRAGLGCTPEEMVTKLEATLAELNYPDIKLYSGNIHEYENENIEKTREPLLPVLLAYARIAGVSVDKLIDDKLDLKNIADRKIDKK